MADQSDGEMKRLIAEVRYLRDRLDILDVVNSYNRGLDRLDAGLIAEAYHPDALDHHGPFVGTAAAFTPFAIECEATFLGTNHGLTTHNCEIDGDTAHAESYVYWFVRQPDGKTIGVGGGRYLDRLERRDGKWKISLRRLLLDYSFQVPADSWLGPDWEADVGARDRTDPSYHRPLRLPPALEAKLARD